MSDVPWLSLLVLLPLVGAVAVPFGRGSAALTKQYRALLGTEGLDVQFTEDGISRIAEIAWQAARWAEESSPSRRR